MIEKEEVVELESVENKHLELEIDSDDFFETSSEIKFTSMSLSEIFQKTWNP